MVQLLTDGSEGIESDDDSDYFCIALLFLLHLSWRNHSLHAVKCDVQQLIIKESLYGLQQRGNDNTMPVLRRRWPVEGEALNQAISGLFPLSPLANFSPCAQSFSFRLFVALCTILFGKPWVRACVRACELGKDGCASQGLNFALVLPQTEPGVVKVRRGYPFSCVCSGEWPKKLLMRPTRSHITTLVGLHKDERPSELMLPWAHFVQTCQVIDHISLFVNNYHGFGNQIISFTPG